MRNKIANIINRLSADIYEEIKYLWFLLTDLRIILKVEKGYINRRSEQSCMTYLVGGRLIRYYPKNYTSSRLAGNDAWYLNQNGGK